MIKKQGGLFIEIQLLGLELGRSKQNRSLSLCLDALLPSKSGAKNTTLSARDVEILPSLTGQKKKVGMRFSAAIGHPLGDQNITYDRSQLAEIFVSKFQSSTSYPQLAPCKEWQDARPRGHRKVH